jgi:hypothetical protein
MDIQLANGFPINPIRVGDGIVLIDIFTLDPDKAKQFVATQVGEYKRLKGQFRGSYTANLHISLDRTRAANYAHFTSVEVMLPCGIVLSLRIICSASEGLWSRQNPSSIK